MRQRTVEITVGAFMLAGVLALIFLAIQVSGLNLRSSSAGTYELIARFNNVAGLTTRAKVSTAGVLIGRVTSISLDPASGRAVVRMAINNDVDYLTIDSIASIQTQGILGEKYISVSLGGDPEVLGDGDEIYDTQSSLVLEELIGKFLTSMGSKE
jgi:phospholipid/cholesterol/gamma-HCH transport system substrate-binding protein